MNGTRSLCATFVFFSFIGCGSITAHAQSLPLGIPGPNVNIIGPTPYPSGVAPVAGQPSPLIEDLQLKQKNEPQCAVRPDEPRHFFCIYNDYRGVDTPAIGDSWIGASMSRDEGLTWLSRLVPGFKSDTLHPSLNLGFAADPMIAAVPGLAVVGFLAANRDGNQPGGLFVQRWVELNKEDGFPWAYADTKQASSGTSGQFRDKPAMLATLAAPGTAPLSLGFTVDGQSVTRQVAAGTLHMAYSNFTGNDVRDTSQIKYLKSTDYGATWSNEVKLSEAVALNQGVSIAADPSGQNLVIVWRSFDFNSNQPNSLVYVSSSNGGNSWTKVRTLGPNFICPFDQDVTEMQFRSKALPQVVNDGTKFYVFWAGRQGNCLTGQARILYVESNAAGTIWGNTPKLVAPFDGGGHQFMPAASAAGGVVQVAWYDTRDDEFYEGSPTEDAFITDSVVTNPTANDSDTAGQPINRRHTADLWHVQFKGAQLQVPVKVSQYAQGTFAGRRDVQLERNYVNARIFRQGTAPFVGDYIAATAPAFRLNGAGQWISNIGAPSASDRAPAEPTFQLAWTDNRHIRSNVFLNPGLTTGYTPPIYNLQGEPGDPSGATQCVPNDPLKALSRAQRVFSSVIKPGVLLSAAAPSKRAKITNGRPERAHVIQLQNLADKVPNTSDNDPNVAQQEVRQYQVVLSLPNQPANGDSASFDQFATTAVTELDVEIPEGSSAARTVFVKPGPGRPAPVVAVNVFNCTNATGVCTPGSRVASLVLNGNPLAADLQDPDSGCVANNSCLSITEFEAHNPDLNTYLYSVENPPYRNPSLRNPSLRNQTYESPSLRNETIESPSLRNPSLRNTSLTDDGAVAADLYTDFVYDVENEGNTTTGYNLRPLITGTDSAELSTQLIVSRVYPEPYAFGCDFSEKSTLETQQVIVNIVQPNVTGADGSDPLADPGATAGPDIGTFLVEPGGKAQVTLRVWGVDGVANGMVANRVWMKVYSQAVNTDGGVGLNRSFDVIGCVGCGVDPDVTPPQLPIASPPPFNTDLPIEANSPGGWLPDYTLPTATDNSGDPVTVTCDIPSGSPTAYPIGNNQFVTCTATDLAGNTSSVQYEFDVADTRPPVLTAPSGTITVAAAVDQTYADVTYPSQVTATDIVGVTSLICVATPSGVTSSDLTLGGRFPVGTTTVSCSAKDAAGNTGSATFTVTVEDTTPPSLTVPAPITAEATSASGAVISFTASATDTVSGSITPTCTPASGSTFGIGATTVNCTATDAAGNIGSESFTVTVRDTTPPPFIINGSPLPEGGSLPPISEEATGPTGAIVTYDKPTAVDVVSSTTVVVCVPASGSLFGLGNTTVTCTATDAAGNTATATFTVTVTDTVAPVLILPAPITALATSGSGAVVNFNVSATDSVSGSVAAICTRLSGSTFALGTTTVNCTATDAAGNVARGSFTITVTDTTAPSLTVPDPITAEATSAAGAVVSFTVSATDTVSGSLAASCTPASGSTFAIGTTTVTCRATDAANNTGSATFTVTVRDTTAPSLTVPANITTTTSGTTAAVTYSVTATDSVSGSVAPTCSSSSPGVSGVSATGGTFPIGSSTVACTAEDGANNTTSKSFTVTVTRTGYFGLDGVYATGAKSRTSAVPLDFGFTGATGARVDSSLARPSVKVYYAGPKCPGNKPANPTFTYPSGGSDYRYSASSLNWQFNWKPSVNGLSAGCYYLAVKSDQTGQEFDSVRSPITLTK